MDKPTLEQLMKVLPDDASEISVPRHDSNELLFNSDVLTKESAKLLGAIPAQKGTYHGPKKRWKVSTTVFGNQTGTPIKVEDLPNAH